MRLTSFGLLALIATATSTSAQQGGGQPGVHFIENWDMDADGVVTLAELKERRGDVFYTFDENDDGILTAAEYVVFDEARAADQQGNPGHGNGMKQSDSGMTLAFNDADKDGAVSREEFVAGAEGWMTLLDRNGDGQVTASDFGRGN